MRTDPLGALVEKAIQHLKKRDPGYQLDPDLTGHALLQVLSFRGASILRGYLYLVCGCVEVQIPCRLVHTSRCAIHN